MSPLVDLPQRVVVAPHLDEREIGFLAGFGRREDPTGAGAVVRRLWPGQPGVRSPWAPCADGCCLHLTRTDAAVDASGWLRFLIREVLSPRAAGAVERAARQHLPGGHRVDGRVVVGAAEPHRTSRLVVVVNNRVREQLLDDELFPLAPAPPRESRAPVVDLDSRRRTAGHRAGHRTER